MLTPEMKALLRRTLPIDHIDDDRIVLRGPVSRGAGSAGFAVAFNPACLASIFLLIAVLARGPAIGEDLAGAPPYAFPLLVMILLSVLVTVASIIFLRRRRTLHIALHRGQYLAHFCGPKSIDICLPLVHPFLQAKSTESGDSLTIWQSPSAYKERENRRPWRRHLRLWPMGRIPKLSLSFPDRDSVDIVPMPGAREADFIVCWEWLLQFIVPARASVRPTPPRRVLRLAGAVNMLREMPLHSFTDEKVGLFWATTWGILLVMVPQLCTWCCGGLAFAWLLDGTGPFPPWVALVCCPFSTASAILLSLRVRPTVTTFTRGRAEACIERLRGPERIPEFIIGPGTYDGQDQLLMVTPRRRLLGRYLYRKAIDDCSTFIEQFCKPAAETEGVDVDL